MKNFFFLLAVVLFYITTAFSQTSSYPSWLIKSPVKHSKSVVKLEIPSESISNTTGIDSEMLGSLKYMGLDSLVSSTSYLVGNSKPGRIMPMNTGWDKMLEGVKGDVVVFIHGRADRSGSLEINERIAYLRALSVRNTIVRSNPRTSVTILSSKLNTTRGAEIIVVRATSVPRTINVSNTFVNKDTVTRQELSNAVYNFSAGLKQLQTLEEKKWIDFKKVDNSLSSRVRFGIGVAGSHGRVHESTYGPSGSLSFPIFGFSYIQARGYGFGSYENQGGANLTLDYNVRMIRFEDYEELYLTGGVSYSSFRQPNKSLDKYMQGGVYGGFTYNIPAGQYNVLGFMIGVGLEGALDVQHGASAWTHQALQPLGAVQFWF